MNNLENFDFFAEGKAEFYNKFSHKSVLCQGKHWKRNPLVTILIPTYNRPELLRQALDSALHQKEFNDYQILVVDNEGKSLDVETPTARMMKDYQEEKVIYYRHDRKLSIYKMDAAVRLARSQWIVFLHDDDLLAENHLKVMIKIIKENKKIKFLSCEHHVFWDIPSNTQIKIMLKERHGKYDLIKCPAKYNSFNYYSNWQGALINRKYYINTGGMPTVSTGVGDVFMVEKFRDRYGIYECKSNSAFYFYRRWKGQETFKDLDKKETIQVMWYQLQCCAIDRYHHFFKTFWKRINLYGSIGKCQDYNKNKYRASIDIEKVVRESGMPVELIYDKRRQIRDFKLLSIYKKIMDFIYRIHISSGTY